MTKRMQSKKEMGIIIKGIIIGMVGFALLFIYLNYFGAILITGHSSNIYLINESNKTYNENTCTILVDLKTKNVKEVYEDGVLKRIENARSLKEKGFNIIFEKDDKTHEIDIIDFNYTSIKFNFSYNENNVGEYEYEITDNKMKTKFKVIEMKLNESTGKFYEQETEYEIEIEENNGLIYIYNGNYLNKKFKLGENSTIVVIEEPDWMNGTFTNTTYLDGSIRLNKPVPVGYYQNSFLPYSLSRAGRVFVSGDYAYIASLADDCLTILNISNKSNPIPVGDYNNTEPPYSIDFPDSVYVSGDYAYVTSYMDDELTILDISNKSNPTPVGHYNNTEPPYSIYHPRGVFVLENYAYVTSYWHDELTILDISNKSNPTPVGHYNNTEPPYSTEGAYDVFVLENYAYVTSYLDDALTILDISNKSNPTPVGHYNNTEPPYSMQAPDSVFVSGDYAYVISYYYHFLTILDISNKSNPTPVGHYNNTEPPYSISSPRGVFVLENYAYVTSDFDNSLTILDISNKSNPTPVGDYIDTEPPYSIEGAYDVFVSGDYAYVTSYWDDSLTILKNEFFSSGGYESEIFNATSIVSWVNVTWDETEPSQTNLSLAFRSCDDINCTEETWSDWDDDSPNNLEGIPVNQYFQFKTKFETTNTSKTPQLNSVNISYELIPPPTYSDNSTNTTLAGVSTLFSLKWTSIFNLSSYIFSWHNGTNWTKINNSGDQETGEQTFSGINGTDILITFDDGIVPPSGWEMGGNVSPAWQTISPGYSGDYGTQSNPAVENYEKVWINTTINYPSEGNVSWYWNVSSENSWDWLCYCIDKIPGDAGCTCSGWSGTADERISGTVAWTQVIKPVSQGTHTFYWVYVKDSSDTSGEDKGAIDEVRFYSTKIEEDIEVNKTPATYSNVLSHLYEKINNITVTVNVSYYNISGSLENGNNNATLWLEVYNGSDWIDEGDFSVSDIGNFSIVVITPSVLTGWKTESNRDVKISARYMDYNSSTIYDTINWTDVWIETYSQQEMLNDSAVSFTDGDCLSPKTECWSNITKTVTQTVGATIKWKIYANNIGDVWNASLIYEYNITQNFPHINFIDPTPPNDTTTTNTSIEINVSITNADNLDEVIYNWDGTNFTMYNDSLVFMMNFDNVSALGENDSYVVDVSGYGNNGTCVTCPTWVSAGKFGGAFDFTGTEDKFENSSSQNYVFSDEITLASWFKYDSTGGSNPRILELSKSADSNSHCLAVDNDASLRAWAECNDNNRVSTVNDETTYDDSNWHHMVYVYNGSDGYLYVDGVQTASSSGACANLDDTTYLVIGAYFSPGNEFNGYIDEVRVWNRSLSADEVQQQYFSNLNKYDTDKWLLYVNESYGEPVGSVTYTYSASAKDDVENENSTETRYLNVNAIMPQINFTDPTPPNDTSTANTSIEINVSITNADNLDEVIYNWDGTNFTMYNDSLVFMMNFDNVSALGENDSYVVDVSGYGNDGICDGISCPTWTSSGKYGGAFEFDGSNDFINISDDIVDLSNDFSIEMWVNPDDNAQNPRWFSMVNGSSTNCSIGHMADDTIYFRLSDSVVETSSYTLDYSGWYHIVWIYDGGTKYIYVNGEQKSTAAGGISANPTFSAVGGGFSISTYTADGTIDEVKVYNRALSTSEIYQQYISNLRKHDLDSWTLWVNQNYSEPLSSTPYTYQAFVQDEAGNFNKTEVRTIRGFSPQINFTDPTLANDTTTLNLSVEINVSIDELFLDEVIYNWDGTNFTIMNDSLILMYNFDNISSLGENETHVVDVSGYGNNGTCYSNGCNWTNSGRYDGAISFNGSGDYIYLIDSAEADGLGTIFSVGMWFKSESISGNNLARLITRDCSDYWCIAVNQDTAYPQNITIYPDGIGPSISFKLVEENTWHYVIVVWDGSNVVTYFDGIQKDSFVFGGFASTSRPIIMGVNTEEVPNPAASEFHGKMDEVRIWNRSLSASEVYQQYASNLRKYDEDSWTLYVNQSENATDRLDEGVYTYQAFAKDVAGNANQTDERTVNVDILHPPNQPTLNYPANESINIELSPVLNITVTDPDNDVMNITFWDEIEPIAAGQSYTCDLLNNGSAMCWGNNDYGQVGNGDNGTNILNPVFVNTTESFVSISTGNYHACGLLNNGSMMCWGRNDDGQIGDGNTTQRENPVFVNTTESFVSISLGQYHTCGLLNNGSMMCWGRNDFGPIGIGSSGADVLNPAFVNTTESFVSISAGGEHHTCGVLSNGSSMCWGWNFFGQIGDGTITQRESPVFVNTTESFVSISLGQHHSCSLLNNGSAMCWGNNDYGQVGNGDNGTNILNPVFVSTTESFVSITTGDYYTCGLLSNGSAVCWGRNDDGQLGIGTNSGPDSCFVSPASYACSKNPVFVNATELFVLITEGVGSHTCGLLNNGSAMCWGRNDYGQIGDGSSGEDVLNPVFVNTTETMESPVIGNATNIASGSDATTTWARLDKNRTYLWRTTVSDGYLIANSPIWKFTTTEGCSPILNRDWVISEEQICDGVEVTTGTGWINITSTGNLTLINIANVTTTKLNILGTGDKVFINLGSEIRIG